jgi:hypothetical protein
MLFDLGSGKKKQVVRVVYAFLAVIFLVGFVGFSIGSGGSPGGILDAIGLGNGSGGSGSVSSQFDDQISNAETRLQASPKDEAALLKLARYQYLKGQAELSVDQSTGQPVVTDTSRSDIGQAVDDWERYLKVAGDNPNIEVATQLVQGYYLLGDAAGAARTQKLVVADQPNSGNYGQLAFFLYASGDIKGGDAAADEAVSAAPQSQKKGLQKQLDGLRKQAQAVLKQQRKQQQTTPSGGTGTSPLQDPFSGVAPGG